MADHDLTLALLVLALRPRDAVERQAELLVSWDQGRCRVCGEVTWGVRWNGWTWRPWDGDVVCPACCWAVHFDVEEGELPRTLPARKIVVRVDDEGVVVGHRYA